MARPLWYHTAVVAGRPPANATRRRTSAPARGFQTVSARVSRSARVGRPPAFAAWPSLLPGGARRGGFVEGGVQAQTRDQVSPGRRQVAGTTPAVRWPRSRCRPPRPGLACPAASVRTWPISPRARWTSDLCRRPLAHVGRVTCRGTKGRQEGQSPYPLGPAHRREQMQAQPAQAAGLLEAFAAGARRVAVDGPRRNLRSTATLYGLIQSQDQRTRRHERGDQQPQQNTGPFPGRPAHPVEQPMVALETRVGGQAERTQRAGKNVVSRSEQRAAEQHLRASPTRTSKKRGEGRANSLHLGGWCKHDGKSLWSVIFLTVYPPAPVSKLYKVEIRDAAAPGAGPPPPPGCDPRP